MISNLEASVGELEFAIPTTRMANLQSQKPNKDMDRSIFSDQHSTNQPLVEIKPSSGSGDASPQVSTQHLTLQDMLQRIESLEPPTMQEEAEQIVVSPPYTKDRRTFANSTRSISPSTLDRLRWVMSNEIPIDTTTATARLRLIIQEDATFKGDMSAETYIESMRPSKAGQSSSSGSASAAASEDSWEAVRIADGSDPSVTVLNSSDFYDSEMPAGRLGGDLSCGKPSPHTSIETETDGDVHRDTPETMQPALIPSPQLVDQWVECEKVAPEEGPDSHGPFGDERMKHGDAHTDHLLKEATLDAPSIQIGCVSPQSSKEQQQKEDGDVFMISTQPEEVQQNSKLVGESAEAAHAAGGAHRKDCGTKRKRFVKSTNTVLPQPGHLEASPALKADASLGIPALVVAAGKSSKGNSRRKRAPRRKTVSAPSLPALELLQSSISSIQAQAQGSARSRRKQGGDYGARVEEAILQPKKAIKCSGHERSNDKMGNVGENVGQPTTINLPPYPDSKAPSQQDITPEKRTHGSFPFGEAVSKSMWRRLKAKTRLARQRESTSDDTSVAGDGLEEMAGISQGGATGSARASDAVRARVRATKDDEDRGEKMSGPIDFADHKKRPHSAGVPATLVHVTVGDGNVPADCESKAEILEKGSGFVIGGSEARGKISLSKLSDPRPSSSINHHNYTYTPRTTTKPNRISTQPSQRGQTDSMSSTRGHQPGGRGKASIRLILLLRQRH